MSKKYDIRDFQIDMEDEDMQRPYRSKKEKNCIVKKKAKKKIQNRIRRNGFFDDE